MRTREEIEKNINKGILHTDRYAIDDYEYHAVTMEVLLDIRDLLQPGPTYTRDITPKD